MPLLPEGSPTPPQISIGTPPQPPQNTTDNTPKDLNYKYKAEIWIPKEGKWKMVAWIPMPIAGDQSPAEVIQESEQFKPGDYKISVYTEDNKRVKESKPVVYKKEEEILAPEPEEFSQPPDETLFPTNFQNSVAYEPPQEDFVDGLQKSVLQAQSEKLKMQTQSMKLKHTMRQMKALEREAEEDDDKTKAKQENPDSHLSMLQIQLKQMELQQQQMAKQMELQQQQMTKQMELQQQQQQQFFTNLAVTIKDTQPKRDDGALVELIKAQTAQSNRFLELAMQPKENSFEKAITTLSQSPILGKVIEFIRPKENPIEKIMPTFLEQTVSTMSAYSTQMMEAVVKMQSAPPPIDSKDALTQKLRYLQGIKDIIFPAAKELFGLAFGAYGKLQSSPLPNPPQNYQVNSQQTPPQVTPVQQNHSAQQTSPQVPTQPETNPIIALLLEIFSQNDTPEKAAVAIQNRFSTQFIEMLLKQNEQDIIQFAKSNNLNEQKILDTIECLRPKSPNTQIETQATPAEHKPPTSESEKKSTDNTTQN